MISLSKHGLGLIHANSVIVFGTHDGPKCHVFPYVYRPYLVLITMLKIFKLVSTFEAHTRYCPPPPI